MLVFFGPLSCWFRISVSAGTHPSINLIGSGDSGRKDLAVKADHKTYVQVLVMFTEPSVKQAVDVHTSSITCKILVC